VVFVPIGDPGGRSSIVARVLRGLQDARGAKIQSMADIARLDRGSVSALYLIDDFSGTGDEFAGWWETIEPIIRPLESKVFVALLVVNNRALSRIRALVKDVFHVELLDDSANVLLASSAVFDDQERSQVLAYCERTESGDKFLRGYGDCGLLVAFKHGCPNNSLPILWFRSPRWQPLFHRYAI
jgi:hypothetical protein